MNGDIEQGGAGQITTNTKDIGKNKEVVETGITDNNRVVSAGEVVQVINEAQHEVSGVVEAGNKLSKKMVDESVVQGEFADIAVEAQKALGELKDEIAKLETEDNLPPEITKGLEVINSVFPENLTDLDKVDESQKEAHREEIQAVLNYVNEDLARAVAVIVPKIKNKILRAVFMDDMIIESFAAIDPEKAFAAYRKELERSGISPDEIENKVKKVEDRITSEKQRTQREEKISHIKSVMENDPALAVKLWKENREKKQDDWKWLENDLERKIKQTADAKLAESLNSSLSFYNNLPDETPGIDTVASKIFHFVVDSFPEDTPWKEKRQLVFDRLASFPEIVALNSIGYYSKQGYTNEERTDLFRQLIGKDRDLTLSKFKVWDLSDKGEMAPDIKAALFSAYRKHRPGEIMRSGIFLDLLPSFSEQEKEEMLDYVVKNEPYSVLNTIKSIEFTDRMKNIVAKGMIENNPSVIFGIYDQLGFSGLPDLYHRIAESGNVDRLLSELRWRANGSSEFVNKSATDEIIKVVLINKKGYLNLLDSYVDGVISLDDEQIKGLTGCGYIGSSMLVKLNNLGKVNTAIAENFLNLKPEPIFESDKKEPAISADQLIDVLAAVPKDLKEDLVRAAFGYLNKLAAMESTKKAEYFQVIEEIDSSPSQEMQKIASQLVDQILNSDFPLEAYKKIEEVFVKNNLPLIGKVYKIFEILHPAPVLNRKLEKSNVSPYLQQAGEQKRYATIFRDLLKVNIQSDNRSLRHFLETLQEGEQILAKTDKEGEQNIESEDLKKLKYFIIKLNTLFLNSQLEESGENLILDDEPSLSAIKKSYDQLRESLQVGVGQTINERMLELFAKPLGYKDIGEVLQAMDESKRVAHERSLNLAASAQDGKLKLEAGDLLKGVNGNFIQSILQNGSVAKEFLGASSDSDLTPLDTDVDMLPNESTGFSFKENLEQSLSKDYGDILFIIKNRGQYNLTTSDTTANYDRSKLELFKTGVHGDRHYGIRTGFPATEIDFFVIEPSSKNFEKLCLEIVQNGYYVPVTDGDGKIIFSPEMYDDYRRFYNGLEKFGGGKMDVMATTKDMKHYPDIIKIKEGLAKNSADVEKISRSISQTVEQVLNDQGVVLKDKLDMSILGAELMDTGSTGRHTNMPGGFDFDLVLRLDDKDIQKVSSIVQSLQTRLTPERDQSLSGGGKGADIHQLRFFGAKNIAETPVDIDIAFVKKSELVVYGSHDAVKDKLEWVKKEKGEEIFSEVVANIILTKKLLKDGEAYKKGDHEGGQGGLGGIGVENWILANNGNMMEAFKSFQAAAYEGGGKLPLDDFKKKYKLIDPGINLKFLQHDNFIQLLTNDGYNRMLGVVDGYLAT